MKRKKMGTGGEKYLPVGATVREETSLVLVIAMSSRSREVRLECAEDSS